MHLTELTKTWGIALTGGIASGKSTIARSLRQRGIVVIDADLVARQVVMPHTEGLAEVVKAFGPHILTTKGELDRAKMREIVFQNPEQRRLLEAIIHRRLAAATQEFLEAEHLMERPRLWFYEASLIFERQRQADFSCVWVAYCPRALQIERLIQRDGGSRDQAEAILAAQMPVEDKLRQAQLVIHTDCTLAELELRIDAALATIPFHHSSPQGV